MPVTSSDLRTASYGSASNLRDTCRLIRPARTAAKAEYLSMSCRPERLLDFWPALGTSKNRASGQYMTRQVQQLLLLAEASEAHNYDFTIVRVQEIAHEAVAYLQRMAESANVSLTVSAAVDDVEWEADHGALFTLLKNLLENAIQHAPAKTSVDVEIQRNTLTVRDWGPGVDVAQLPLLFERFWRAAHRRDQGAGLGLAICQEIALAHGWRLTAERAEPGLLFRLAVPAPDVLNGG